jgi:hypothetical protein
MTALPSLMVPILVSAIVIFVVSSLIHMVLPWHKTDYPKLANEDSVLSALGPLALPPGDYLIPRAQASELKSPEYQAKVARGPVIVMTVLPNGPISMGRNLTMWFVYIVAVSIFAAYVASRAVAPGAPYLEVFRFAGVTAFSGYALALWQMSIWYGRSWSMTVKSTVDGLIYALLTAGIFGWLWPK